MATPEARDTALVADPIYRTHDPGPGHPESPKRFDTVVQALHGSGLISLSARAATYDELALCHTSAYLAQVRADFARGARSLSTGDTDIGPASYEAALRAAGGVMNAVDAVIAGRVRNAFCAVRPPGHHATPTRGMGFCIFNNVAIAAR
jgi:acetoin utilization deacetylase AcuC-like enzyme